MVKKVQIWLPPLSVSLTPSLCPFSTFAASLRLSVSLSLISLCHISPPLSLTFCLSFSPALFPLGAGGGAISGHCVQGNSGRNKDLSCFFHIFVSRICSDLPDLPD